MLTLQRPSMGSSKPPHRAPFGYNIDVTSDFPFQPPPAPAPGPSLLDDADSKFMSDFFDEASSNNFNDHDFFDKALGVSNGYDIPYGWSDLPPTFMGTTSSFGGAQQQQPPETMEDANFGLMGNEGPSVTTADILAAETLMSGQNSNFHGDDILAAQDISHTLQAGPSPTNSRPRASMHSMAPFPTSTGTAASTLPQKETYMHDSYYTEMVFGSTKPAPKLKTENLQWGTDSGFGASSFVAPPGQDSIKRMEKEMLAQLDCIHPRSQASSTNTTQPSSPVVSRLVENERLKNGSIASRLAHRPSHPVDDQEPLHPKKRRKSSAATAIINRSQEEEEEESNKSSSRIAKRKQSSTTGKCGSDKASPTTPTTTNPSKRRKSANVDGSTKKSARENLTEDQKRENHIRSEQKRRTLIKEGFEDLGELVPELSSGGFSKSAVLLMAGDWLEDLIRGNEMLREQLRGLEARVQGGGLG